LTGPIAGYAAVVLFTLLVVQQWYLRSRLKEQRRIQLELRTSERKFSGILSIAADAIITVDSTFRIVHFNRGAEETFGWSASDAIGRHLAIMLPPRFRESHDKSMEMFSRSSATARRMADRREIFGQRADGTEFPAEASISKLVEADGILFTVVLRDITRQKNVEADDRFLAAAATEFARNLAVDATLQEIVDLPIPRLGDCCLLDVVVSQTRFMRMVSTRQHADLSAPLAQLGALTLSADSPSPAIDVIRRNRTTVIDEVNDEWLDGNADLEAIAPYRMLGNHAQLILPLHVAGETIGALTILRTGTRPFDSETQALAEKYLRSAVATLANAKLYETARRANRARDEVLGVVSHDLRNPINAIAMCAKALASEHEAGTATNGEMLHTIQESAAWMNRLIGDLLDVASIDRGHLALERQSQDASKLVQQALHMFAMDAAAHGITLTERIPPNVPPINVDGARIVQVLGNLVRNALNFTPRGGTVVVSIESRNEFVFFSVSDTGPGISAENLPRIFERYWQSSHAARTRGSGLGLSIAKGIVEAHGGRIWAESVELKGSEFLFSIPVGALASRAGVVGDTR